MVKASLSATGLGNGMFHGVRLREGKAEWYRNRWIRPPAVARALGESAPHRAAIQAGLELIGANTNVLNQAGRKGGVASYELTDDLGTVGPCDIDGTLRGGYWRLDRAPHHAGPLDRRPRRRQAPRDPP